MPHAAAQGMHPRFVCIVLTVCALCGLASRAHAQSVHVGILGGYGFTTDDDDGIEPYGVGIGASAGLTLPIVPIYLGARAVWHLGESARISAGGATLQLDRHYALYAVDLGYDAALGPITLRPALGVGAAVLENGGSAVGVAVSASDSSLYLAPGVGLIVSFGLLYAGGELRFNYVTEDGHFNGISMLASVGLTI